MAEQQTTTVAKDRLSAVADAIKQEIKAHPYRTLGIAAGVGFALGAGLSGPILGLLSTRAGRIIALRLLEPMLDKFEGSAIWSGGDSPVH